MIEDESSFSPDANKLKPESSCSTIPITPKLKKSLSPILLKHGLTISHNIKRSMPHFYWNADIMCLLPTSQELISCEVFDDYRQQYYQNENRVPGNEVEEERQENNKRLDILEDYLLHKKVLFPNNKWSDSYRWKDNYYFTMWLRHEFLLAKYLCTFCTTVIIFMFLFYSRMH